MNPLSYIYDRLKPFKLDTADKAGICPDICGVTRDVVDDAGITEKELERLPKEAYLGFDVTLTPECTVREGYHIFSKSALGAYVGRV